MTADARSSAGIGLVVTLVMVVLVAGASGFNGNDTSGLLLSLEATRDGCRLVSAAATPTFVEPRQLQAPGDWTVELRAGPGDVLWQTRVRNPWHLSPPGDPNCGVPFSATAPNLVRATAVAVLDHAGRELLVVALDASFAARAEAERQRFLAHDQRNRARIDELRARRDKSGATVPRTDLAPRFEHLDDDLRARVSSRVNLDLERLAHYGLPPRQALHSGGGLARAAARLRVVERLAHGAGGRPDAQLKTLQQHVLSGQVRDVETGQPVAGAQLYFYQYDFEWESEGYIGTTSTSFGGNYSMVVSPGWVYVFCGSPTDAVYAGQLTHTLVVGDQSLDVLLFPGVVLSGTVSSSDGSSLSGVEVHAESPRFWSTALSDGSGAYAMVVPRDQEFLLSAGPNPPWAAPEPADLRLAADGSHDLVLERGHVVSGRVRDVGAAYIAGATVAVRHLASSTTASPSWSAVTSDFGRWVVVIPQGLRPSSFVVSIHQDGYVRHAAGLVVSGDTTHDATLITGVQVTGVVQDDSGQALEGAIVRAFQDEMYVTSATAEEDGSYAIGLQPGTYTFRASPYHDAAPSSLAPAEEAGVEVTDATELDFTLHPADAIVTLRLHYPDDEAYELGQGVMRVEVRQDGRPLFVTLDSAGQASFDWDSQTYVKETRLYLEAGTYDLALYAMGHDPTTLSGVVATSGTETLVVITQYEPYVWAGVLRSAEGTALPQLPIVSYDDISTQYTVHFTDANGQFRVPLTPGGTLRFFSPDRGSAIRRIERLGDEVASRQEDCVLDEFPEADDSGGVLTRIWGSADTTARYNLVILGDGYTDITETFTDINGNGVWDGVLYTDLNGNGVWDDYPERYAVYGNAPAPQAGTDPTVGNEPFDDINQDGSLNLDDQALFDANASELVRSLFGSDVWADYRDAFSVYRIRIVSEQAGYDLLDEEYRVVSERDTALDTRVMDPSRRYVLRAHDPLVMQYVNTYAPFADTHVVLVNQPVQIGRANSYIIMRGGPTSTNANHYVMSHEMGHNVGWVADEYVEFPETYEGGEPLRPNITTFTERDRIPWKDLLPADQELPSVHLTPGLGLYEGAYYQPGGVYRPVERCVMRGSERFCPVCTREIRHRVTSLTGEFPGEVDLVAPRGRIATLRPTFEWRGPSGASHYRLEVEEMGGGTTLEQVDVYSDRFGLETDLEVVTAHRWRVQPGSEHHWGQWSEWAEFSTPLPVMDGAAPGVASAPGSAGSDWHSDLWLHNAADQAASVRLYLAPRDESMDHETSVDTTVAAGATVAMRDVVATAFDTLGSGAVQWQVVDGNAQLVLVEGRTYNRLSETEHMGHGVLGMLWNEAPAAGTATVLPVAAGEHFRTNLDVVSDHVGSRVQLLIRDAAGTVVVDDSLDVGPGTWVQIGNMAARYGLDPTVTYAATVTGIDAQVVAGNSVVDNHSNDGTRMLAQTLDRDDEPLWLVGAAFLSGAGNSDWRSSLTLIDGGEAAHTVGLIYVPRGGSWDGRVHQQVVVPAGGALAFANVLDEVFGLAEGAVGSLRVEPSAGRSLAAFMRTYALEQGASGELTYGQYVAPWAESEAVRPGFEGRIVGLNHTASFRTNLLLQNTHTGGDGAAMRPTTATIEVLAPDGALVASRTMDLDPGENVQTNNVIPSLMGPGAELGDFVIVVTVDAEDFDGDATGGVIAAASEVNGNVAPGTNDPRLVRARLVPAVR